MKPFGRATRWVALFCLWLLPLACRDGTDPPLTPGAIAFHPAFAPGDVYEYDAILISEFGYYLPSTRSRATQRILSTGGTFAGFTGVTTVLDSTVLLRDTTATVQEFMLAQSADGDLYRFGLLAEIARVTGLPVPPRRWDRIAAFSQGIGGSWVVGSLDSAGRETVYGSFTGSGGMVSANINGVQTLFSCYQVSIFIGGGTNYIFQVSDSPPAFARYILEPGDSTKGVDFTLTDARVSAP